MSDNQRMSNEDIIRKNMEIEDQISESISQNVEKVFSESSDDQLEFHKETAYRVYSADKEIEDLRHQVYYATSVIDALVKILISQNVASQEVIEQFVNESHEKLVKTLEEHQEFIMKESLQREQEESSPQSSVTEI